MKRFFSFLFAALLMFCVPVWAAAENYDEHIQYDGGWHVENSKGGEAASVLISGSDDGLFQGMEIKVFGGNLLNINAPPQSKPHVTYTVDDNKITVVSDSASSTAALRFTVDVMPNTVYYLKCKAQQALAYADAPFSSGVYVRDVKDNSYLLSRVLSKNTSEQTITGTFNSGNRNQFLLWLYPRTSAVADSPNTTIYSDIMISPQNIPYEPYNNLTALVTPCDLFLGDMWDVLAGTVTRSDGSVEFYDSQSVVLPVGIVNVLASGRPGSISIRYNYDASGGSGGVGEFDGLSDIQGNTFTRIMSGILNIFKIDFTLYGYTFSFWDVFVYSLLLGIVITFVRDLIYG